MTSVGQKRQRGNTELIHNIAGGQKRQRDHSEMTHNTAGDFDADDMLSTSSAHQCVAGARVCHIGKSSSHMHAWQERFFHMFPA